ncbi:MAG: replication protein [Defluviitaleaceae bacterium]|nr:replication protein [Defluviitaleaceae bacterium]
MATNSKEVQQRADAKRAAKKREAHKMAVGWRNEKTKARSWAFIVYPESTPENWQKILQKTGVAFAISPLHDSDKDPTEEDKKPHWHVIAVWVNGSTTGKIAKRISDSVNAVTPIPLNGIKGYYRYLTHKDNPEKYQYDDKDIQTLNGFNIFDFVEQTRSEVNALKRRLQELIRELGITEYAVLMDYLVDEGLSEEYDIASSHTYFFDKHIASRRNMAREGT